MAKPITSEVNVASCPRCGSPIARGQKVERFGAKYAHLGCSEPAAVGPMFPDLSKETSVDELVYSTGAGETIPISPEEMDLEPPPGAAEFLGEGDGGIEADVGGEYPAQVPSVPEIETAEVADGDDPDAPEMEIDDSFGADEFEPQTPFTLEEMDSEPPDGGPDDTQLETEGDSDVAKPKPPVIEEGEEAPPKGSEEFRRAVKDAVKDASTSMQAQMQTLMVQASQAALPKIRDQLVDQAKKIAEETCEEIVQRAEQAAREMYRKALDSVAEQVKQAASSLSRSVVTIERPDALPTELNETTHEAFEEIVKKSGAGFNVFMFGPTGSGKTVLAAQVARGLGLDFGMLSGTSGTTESEFFGTSHPNITTGANVYMESDFVRLYENGGLFFVDEADGLDPNTWLKVNAAIANGFATVPKRYGSTRAARHKNFVCMIGANTVGMGATQQYVGRNKFDLSTRDRFLAGSVYVGYSAKIEQKVCPNVQLLAILMDWRAKIAERRLSHVLSTRFVADAYRLMQIGYKVEHIARQLTFGWTDAEARSVTGMTAGGK